MYATITEKQAAILKRKGIPYDPNTSRNEARKLVKLAMNSASQRTRSRLDAFGIEYDPFISQSEAYALLDQHASQTRTLYNDLNGQTELLFDLASQVVNWSQVTPAHAKGPCPMCNGSNFHVNRVLGLGGCTGCEWEKGTGAGPVGFYAKLHGLEWHEATRQLANAPTVTRPVTRTVTVHVPQPVDRAKWLDQWTRRLNYGHGRLSVAQNATRAYLESRGIDYATMKAFNVSTTTHGYGKYRHVECCLFPYYDTDGKLCAINRRLTIDDTDDKVRMAKGSLKGDAFFGVWGFSGFVWVIEGEINAMSTWQALQALGRSDTVLSVSSETDIKARADEFVSKWGKDCVVWCDSPKICDVVRDAGLSCWSTRQDANDLLLAGQLEACLMWILDRVD